MSYVFDLPPDLLTPGERLVALVLADHANGEGGHAYPSVPLIARKAGITPRAVTSCLGGLKRKGVIAGEKVHRHLPTVYHFVAFRPEARSGLGLFEVKIVPAERNDVPLADLNDVPSGVNVVPFRPERRSGKPLLEPSSEHRDSDESPAGARERPPSKKTRIAPDWQPSAVVLDWCADEVHLTAEQTFKIVEAFRDYWLGEGKTKVDWNATFRVWVRREVDRGLPISKNGHAPRVDAAAYLAWENVAIYIAWREGGRRGEKPEAIDDPFLDRIVKSVGNGWGNVVNDTFTRNAFFKMYAALKETG